MVTVPVVPPPPPPPEVVPVLVVVSDEEDWMAEELESVEIDDEDED